MDSKTAEVKVKAEEDRSGSGSMNVEEESPPVVQHQVEEPSSSNVTAAQLAATTAELAALRRIVREKKKRIRGLEMELYFEENYGLNGYGSYLKWKEETQAVLVQIVEKQKLVYQDVHLEKLLDQLKIDHEMIGYDAKAKAFR